MVERINLADPSFEPTDQQLTELSSRAFSRTARSHELALEKLRADIAKASAAVLDALEARLAPRKAPK
jgi:hypothetical protein